jgi:TldD protein
MTNDHHFQTAERHLLTPYDLTPARLSGVFGEMFGHRLDAADLYFQFARSEAWSLEEGIVKSGSFNIEQGVGVRAVSGEKTAFAYSDDISLPALLDAATGACRCWPVARCRRSTARTTRSVRWPTRPR